MTNFHISFNLPRRVSTDRQLAALKLLGEQGARVHQVSTLHFNGIAQPVAWRIEYDRTDPLEPLLLLAIREMLELADGEVVTDILAEGDEQMAVYLRGLGESEKEIEAMPQGLTIKRA